MYDFRSPRTPVESEPTYRRVTLTGAHPRTRLHQHPRGSRARPHVHNYQRTGSAMANSRKAERGRNRQPRGGVMVGSRGDLKSRPIERAFSAAASHEWSAGEGNRGGRGPALSPPRMARGWPSSRLLRRQARSDARGRLRLRHWHGGRVAALRLLRVAVRGHLWWSDEHEEDGQQQEAVCDAKDGDGEELLEEDAEDVAL
mmetsp:Transcript_21932/g.74007  ORF Transcript_21932/g.74007 Transcript_21932/m.74007 type:complete len:200 (+) Transcript_21932:281-880(+)